MLSDSQNVLWGKTKLKIYFLNRAIMRVSRSFGIKTNARRMIDLIYVKLSQRYCVYSIVLVYISVNGRKSLSFLKVTNVFARVHTRSYIYMYTWWMDLPKQSLNLSRERFVYLRYRGFRVEYWCTRTPEIVCETNATAAAYK